MRMPGCQKPPYIKWPPEAIYLFPKKLPVVVLEERYGRSILPRAAFEGFPSAHDCADGAVVKIVVGLLQGRFALCARPTMPTP